MKVKNKMLTAKTVLETLVSAGFIDSYKKIRGDEYGFKVTNFVATSDKLSSINNETIGEKSFLIFYCYGPREAAELVEIIRKAGGEPNTCPKKDRVDLRVSYFKGSRWWE